MTLFTNENFANEDVNVDGNQYEKCAFDTVVLIYKGGAVPTFNDCTFRNVKIDLQGDAGQTAGYLNNLYDKGMSQEVEQVMAEVQTGARMPTQTVEPPPPLYTGDNHQRPLIFIAITFAVVAWFYGMYVYGWIFQPYNTLESGEPIRSEVSFNLIPRLPDDLAVEYDAIREDQLSELNGGNVTDEGSSTISIDAAIAQVLENGFVVGDDADADSDDGTESEEDEEESSSG